MTQLRDENVKEVRKMGVEVTGILAPLLDRIAKAEEKSEEAKGLHQSVVQLKNEMGNALRVMAVRVGELVKEKGRAVDVSPPMRPENGVAKEDMLTLQKMMHEVVHFSQQGFQEMRQKNS